MAKILYGGGVANMSGSEGGTVHSRNRGGNYTRQRVTPVNPATTRQLVVRQSVSSLSKKWTETLTQAQRNAWDDFALLNPTTDSLGQIVILTGQQFYVRINTRLEQGLVPVVNDAPANQLVSNIGVVTLSVSQTGPAFSFTFGGTVAGTEIAQLFVTPGFSPGSNFIKNKVKLITNSSLGASSPIDFTVDWVAEYGAVPAIGQKVSVLARILRITNGAISTSSRADTFVVAV